MQHRHMEILSNMGKNPATSWENTFLRILPFGEIRHSSQPFPSFVLCTAAKKPRKRDPDTYTYSFKQKGSPVKFSRNRPAPQAFSPEPSPR